MLLKALTALKSLHRKWRKDETTFPGAPSELENRLLEEGQTANENAAALRLVALSTAEYKQFRIRLSPFYALTGATPLLAFK